MYRGVVSLAPTTAVERISMRVSRRRKRVLIDAMVRCGMCMRAVAALVLLSEIVSSFQLAGLPYHDGVYPKAHFIELAIGGGVAEVLPLRRVGAHMHSYMKAGETTVRVIVKRSTRNPIDTSQLTGYGSTFYAPGYEEEWVLMQTISGVADGKDVIAVIAPGKYPPGSAVEVESRHVVEKPRHLDWDRAVMLPFLAVSCLCPLRDVGFDASTSQGRSFVVTGGHGSLAPFMMQVLKAWGADVCCVTTKSQVAARALGAKSAVDFRGESYSEVVEDIKVVIDTLGREKEGTQRILKQKKGAAYVSLQPRVLKVAIEEGVLFGAGKILQYQQVLAKDDARIYFLPNAEGMEMVSQVASMVSSKDVDFGVVGTDYVGMQEYMEALAWPKDTDTGLRYGFPGKTGRAWGWLEGVPGEMDDDIYEDDDYYDDDEDGEEQSQGAARERILAEIDSSVAEALQEGPTVPNGEVVPVNSREELTALAQEGGTMVFVGSKRCRVCKFLSPFYRKLARRQQLVWFGYVDASSNPEIARDLGLKAVPSFVTFRQGEVVTSTNTNSRDKIEKLVEELLLG